MAAFYNEIDPAAAAWLRELIKAGHIAPGVVDERDIRDIAPAELVGFTQCHFFAGIGVWSHALREAGWPDDRACWTGSCPCQPFSSAGKGVGFDDERHLWPDWFWLIGQCRPVRIFGEQVASKDALAWLDIVSADLEGADYSVGAVDLCAAGFGAPHIRQRLFWVADSGRDQSDSRRGDFAEVRGLQDAECRTENGSVVSGGSGGIDGMADACSERRQQVSRSSFGNEGQDGRQQNGYHVAPGISAVDGMADANGSQSECMPGRRTGPREAEGGRSCSEPSGCSDAARLGIPNSKRCGSGSTSCEREARTSAGAPDTGEPSADESPAEPGPTNGFWADAEWLPCRDQKLRPTKPGVKPLAHRPPARVGRLRGYGNAIVGPVATDFITVVEEALK